ncbi:MAG TPA: 30S ribosomal protein S8 [Thermoanaerobaculia bacterium]|jgi:small subunit ribosomal protein S8|nr:30S ribosomal protein S8 [Thermoanaerobaculia bacterium]
MKTSDPLSDLFTRLRNGMRAGHDRVDVPSSRLKEAVLKVLEQEGFISSFRKVQEGDRPVLRVGLKYDHEGEPIVAGIERVSRPGRRIYAKADAIPQVLGGLGVSIVSTSRGIVTDKKARQARLGGEVLCNVW